MTTQTDRNSTTVSETCFGSWAYGSHTALSGNQTRDLRAAFPGYELTTYIYKGDGGYENQVPRCQGTTKASVQCTRAGIVNTSGGWHAVTRNDGLAVCSQHAKGEIAEAGSSARMWQELFSTEDAIVCERAGVVVREWVSVYDAENGARRAEVFILHNSDNVAANPSNWHKVCDVVRRTDVSYSEPVTRSLRPTTLNWSAWGDQTSETTLQFSKALDVATRVARLYDEGGRIDRAVLNTYVPVAR